MDVSVYSDFNLVYIALSRKCRRAIALLGAGSIKPQSAQTAGAEMILMEVLRRKP
jgi:hypothetical protein